VSTPFSTAGELPPSFSTRYYSGLSRDQLTVSNQSVGDKMYTARVATLRRLWCHEPDTATPLKKARVEPWNPSADNQDLSACQIQNLQQPVVNSAPLPRDGSAPANQALNDPKYMAQELHRELIRRETFRTCPSTLVVSKEALAKAGFFYVAEDDCVQCAFCKRKTPRSFALDQPLAVHKVLNSLCPFVAGLPTKNVPLTDIQPTADDRVRLKFEFFRLRTFRKWPATSPVPKEELAKAGFFFYQDGDSVQCVFCLKKVSAWYKGDEPMKVHQWLNPGCPFVLGESVGNVPIEILPDPMSVTTTKISVPALTSPPPVGTYGTKLAPVLNKGYYLPGVFFSFFLLFISPFFFQKTSFSGNQRFQNCCTSKLIVLLFFDLTGLRRQYGISNSDTELHPFKTLRLKLCSLFV
jgi:hypothetical protein